LIRATTSAIDLDTLRLMPSLSFALSFAHSSCITAWQLAHLAEQGFIHGLQIFHFFDICHLATTIMASFIVGGTFIHWICSTYLDVQ
jgi:hypothetical protein